MGLWASENNDSGDSTESVDNLIKQDNWMLSPGVAEGGIVSQGTNTGTFKVTEITKALLRTTASATGNLEPVTLSEQDNQIITSVDTVYYVVFTYGTPCIISLSTTAPNGFNEIPLGKVAKDSADKIYYVSGGYRLGDGVSKLHKRAMSLRALELKHGSTIAYSGTNNFTLTPGVVFGGLNEYLLSAYDSAVTQYTAIYNDNAGGWTEGASNAIDFAHYDDLSGTLNTIKNNMFGVHYLFKHVDDQNVYVVYGLGSYALAEAILQASQLPDIPSHLLEFGVLIGSIVVPQLGGSFTEILSPTDQFFDCTQVADHANLSNLDFASAGHTGFANSGTNDNITSMAGLEDGGIPLEKVNGATNYPDIGEQAFLDADRTKLDNIEIGATVDMQNALIATVSAAMDAGGLANREIDRLKNVLIQEGGVTVKNRGVIKGCSVSKSDNTIRNLNLAAGKVFAHGRTYPVNELLNTAVVPVNNTATAATCYVYLFDENGDIQCNCTGLGEAVPENGIEIYSISVPAGNNETTDPHLANVTLTDTRRLEPNWPNLFENPAFVYVPLANILPDSDYAVDTEVVSLEGGRQQAGELIVENRLKNGFKFYLAGAADAVVIRYIVTRLKA